MTRFTYLFVLAFTAFTSLVAQSAKADSPSYSYICTIDGVQFSSRSVRELPDQYRTEISIENTRPCAVEVRYDVVFERGAESERCVGGMFTLQPYAKKSGQWTGQIWYPFERPHLPGLIRIVNVHVTEK